MIRRDLFIISATALLAKSARAQTARPWPAQPVRLIVPFSAGVTDTIGRLVSAEMARRLGQPFVVDSRPGAGGNIGSEVCARAPADGYTLCMGTRCRASKASPGTGCLPRPRRRRPWSRGCMRRPWPPWPRPRLPGASMILA